MDDFAIAVTYDGDAPVEGENTHEPGISYIVEAHEGESFVKIDDDWIDMSKEDVRGRLNLDFIPGNCCIKAIY